MSSNVILSQWQKKQAALLYYFSSMPYLKEVKNRVDHLLSYSEGTLDLARHEHRDLGLKNAQWGNRDTAENWANCAAGSVARRRPTEVGGWEHPDARRASVRVDRYGDL